MNISPTNLDIGISEESRICRWLGISFFSSAQQFWQVILNTYHYRCCINTTHVELSYLVLRTQA